ncbi:MAG: M23 family metallopeptidase [candidate division KSB1 bacterium]|nr:M23 family metallopeptidase [candidate division KSB1 bacterium]
MAIFLICIKPIFAQDEEYVWPTDASRWITSSFAEFRPRRFHAAIDIKTWNRTGYKIFAVRDGYVQRIRVSPFGYGKAIYLKLDTGEIAVYAHLSKFNPKLEKIVWQEQAKNGRYRVDRYFAPNVIPVKKGEFLGYTGETGIGVPHLHFELRDPSNRPINPFTRGFRIQDRRPPTPTKVAVMPLSFGSRVQNDFKPWIIRPKRVGPGQYVLPDTVSIEGEIGVAVAGFDQSGGVNNRFGFYRIELRLDGELHYRTQYDRFNYAHNRFVELDRDFRLHRRGFGLFYRLFLDPANRLTFYDYAGEERGRLITSETPSPQQIVTASAVQTGGPSENAPHDSGIILSDGERQLLPGLHRFEIVIEDFFDNRTTIAGMLRVGKKFRIFPQYSQQDSGIVLQQMHFSAQVRPEYVELWEQSGHRKPRWRLSQRIAFPDDNGARYTSVSLDDARPFLFPLADRRASIYKLLTVDALGQRSWPDFIVLPGAPVKNPLKLSITPDVYDDYVRIRVRANQPLRKPPVLEVALDDGSSTYPVLYAKSPSEYVAALSAYDLADHRVRLRAQAENALRDVSTAETELELHLIPQGTSRRLYSADSLFRLHFWKQSLYRDMFARIDIEEPPAGQRDRDRVSRVYVAHPQDVPLNSGVQVSIRYPDMVSDPSKLGVYYFSRNKWVFIDNKLDTEAKRVSALVLSLEKFALRKDDTPPTVIVRVPGKRKILKPTTPIRVYAKDEQSGFESEESLELYIDGRKVIAEYDPENDVVVYAPRRPLTPGTHQLRFKATDKSGNVTVVTRTFTVQP